jgi:hypothetical protein
MCEMDISDGSEFKVIRYNQSDTKFLKGNVHSMQCKKLSLKSHCIEFCISTTYSIECKSDLGRLTVYRLCQSICGLPQSAYSIKVDSYFVSHIFREGSGFPFTRYARTNKHAMVSDMYVPSVVTQQFLY